jgi:hypothetical protein
MSPGVNPRRRSSGMAASVAKRPTKAVDGAVHHGSPGRASRSGSVACCGNLIHRAPVRPAGPVPTRAWYHCHSGSGNLMETEEADDS